MTVPEYVAVPGPTEYWYPPEELLQPCVEQGATPLTLGLMEYGMSYADLLGTVAALWHQYLLTCDQRLREVRELMRQHKARPPETAQ